MTRTWNSVLARLGVPTGDGRIIAPGGGSSRSLPRPLLYQPATDDGHGGAIVVGRIETVNIGDGMVTATGRLLEDIPYSVVEQLEAGVIGPSVDLDDIEYTVDDQERIVVTRWRIAGATLVAIPAFADVSLTLDPVPAADETGVDSGETFDGPLFAAAGQSVAPPLEWFKAPDLDRLTPLTVSDSGRVFGHIAGWSTCHVGLPGCVTPPFSASGYAYFMTGEQATAEGVTVPVGTLVAGPRHAAAADTFKAAQAHYDDPAAAVAKVVAGEDEFGIWVAGWMLPGAEPGAVEVFRSSAVSGDWRRVGGSLELIAVCSVNAPGFPVPRARVAFSDGAQRSLIGNFGMVPVSGDHSMGAHEVIKDDGSRARWAWAAVQEGI